MIEIHETSSTTLNDMVAKVVAMQEEARVNKETELERAEQRLRAKNKSHARARTVVKKALRCFP